MRERYATMFVSVSRAFEPIHEVLSIFEGRWGAHALAEKHRCDVEHRVYNTTLRRWERLTTYHADGTGTNMFGERRLFVGELLHRWGPVIERETKKGGGR